MTEYSCEDDAITSSLFICDYRCSNGACIDSSSTCSENDGGNNLSGAGVTKLVVGTTQTGEKDRCIGNNIKEYFCENTKRKSVTVKCQGICKNTSVPYDGNTITEVGYCEPQPESCTDSDSSEADPSLVQGTVSIVNVRGVQTTYEDKCEGKKVLEYSCDGNSMASNLVECSDICVNGACTVRANLCEDSDSGNKADVKGTINNSYGSFTDFCSNQKRLVEGYCKQGDSVVANSKTNSLIHLKTFICKNNCQDGVCLGAVE